MVKILGVCGSPRNAATEFALSEALKAAKEIPDVEVEMIELKGKKINPCIACNVCVKKEINRCQVYEDDMNEIYERFFEADAFIIASPVYLMSVSPQLTAFFSRFRPEYLIQRKDSEVHLHKLGAAIAVGGTRNGGQETTINAIHQFYHSKGVTIVNGGIGIYAGASVWSQDKMAQGAEEDLKGMESARTIGRRLAKVSLIMKKGLEK